MSRSGETKPAEHSLLRRLKTFTKPCPGKRARHLRSAIVLVAAVAFSVWVFGAESQGEHFGWWSVAPPLVAIVLAFWTREVVSSLFAGILLGGLIAGEINLVQSYMIPSIGSESFALILLVYLWALGGLIGIWTRTGGAETFALWAGRRFVKGPRSAKLFTWVMGLIFHQGGTISTILTGATVPAGGR
jgi:Na+/H+ antiporter